MIYSNIKNTSVQLAGAPSQQVRLISSATSAELAAALDTDILNAKLTSKLVASGGTEYDDTVVKADIANLKSTKVDKSGTKVLTDVNFSTADKSKLDGIAANANKTVYTNVLTSTSTAEALTAAQGKVLKDLIDALTARVAALEVPTP